MREVNSNSHLAAVEHLELCSVLAVTMSTFTKTYLNGKIGTGFLGLDRVCVTG